MYYITHDNKIMAWHSIGTDIEVINNTGYLPLCMKGDIVLMSNNKLYVIKMFERYKLCELTIKMKSCVLNNDDFNTRFVIINLKCYEINAELSLTKINNNITLNNHINIIELYGGPYLYCDASNNLILFDKWKNQSPVILDNQVDTILFCTWNGRSCTINIIYKKLNTIICSSYSRLTLIDTYTINYEGSHIVKILDIGIFLDTDKDVYMVTFVDNKYILEKMGSDVIDINSYNMNLYIIDTEHRLYYAGSRHHKNYVKTHIANNCYFTKTRRSIKSANK
jgi:hypothetical protein